MYALIRANKENFYIVKGIVQTTIRTVYPKYYPRGTVSYLMRRHSDDSILRDLEAGQVYLLLQDGHSVGTGTIREGRIDRVFIMTSDQGSGHGTQLMDQLEDIAARHCGTVSLDSPLSSYDFYIHRGYRQVEYVKMPIPSGDVLCFFRMEKVLGHGHSVPGGHGVKGVSHLTFVVSDLERSARLFTETLGGKEVYASGEETFSLSRERFFLLGDTWICLMEGDPPEQRSYNHVAFRVSEEELEEAADRIKAAGCQMRPSRPRVEGEGRSIYFYDYDGHLFELHAGTLEERLQRYRDGDPPHYSD